MPDSVRIARSITTAHLEAWGATIADVAHGQVADAVLIVSELVANAVRHCTHELEVSLVCHRDRIEIAVTDDNPEPAVLKQPHPLVPGGRGLLLVDALAQQWGQQQVYGRKTVWARLSIPPGSALARNCSEPVGRSGP
ncbi:MAG: ATP-binding protein [Acidimicrobiales bacterium]|nr:ATP-binding protein [Acidimicrobiales bacterium]